MVKSAARAETIGLRLDRNGGVGRGFDALRVLLAMSILIYHSFDVVLGPSAETGAFWLLIESLVPMFFALSGFLISASGQRLSLPKFLLHRGLRIFPALLIEIVFSAFVLGLLMTGLSFGAYLSSGRLYRYLLNITGNVQYTLPGVFIDHPHGGIVNASLWTIPWELVCYALISIAICTGMIRKKRSMLIAALVGIVIPSIIYCILVAAAALFPSVQTFARIISPDVYFNPQILGAGGYGPRQLAYWFTALLLGWEFRVVPFFLAGSALYLLRYSVPYSPRIAWAIAAAMLLGCLFLPASLDTPLLNLLLCPALVYLTIIIGVTDLPALPIFRHGDYSYGIYLYGYPLQQAIYGIGLDRKSWQLNAIISIVIVTMFAAFSWHCIERPILSRRKAIEQRLWRRDGKGEKPS